ncbi:TldD/PmbA family protein [Kribbella sp. GL6]|uniref:TldD/PmbA family protein n=1 Tax=Kribbella sp. GL6 TaxID=3419765 RepID=UPI003CFE2D55
MPSAHIDITRAAIETALAAGAGYADARAVHTTSERFAVGTGRLTAAHTDESMGLGVRVQVDGVLGFAAGSDLSRDGLRATVEHAVELARAGGPVQRVRLADRPVATGYYATPIAEDPASIGTSEKVDLLLAADAAAREVRGVTATQVDLGWRHERKAYADSEGSTLEQDLWSIGAGLEVYASNDSERQRRSCPDSRGGRWATGGFEFVRALDLPGQAGRVAEEAVELLTAPVCPSGPTTVILDPSQLHLQIHESCGHAFEGDRILGDEAAYAGTSFVTPAMAADGFRYGSDLVTLVADATAAGGLGTFGWDDEGVPAQRVPLVEAGRVTGLLTSRASAGELGVRAGGQVRAESWNRLPMIRMTNINLEPVPGHSLDDLIAATDDGLYLSTNKSWSIDDRRWGFQFGTEVAREIRGGELGRLYRNPTYSGTTVDFWRSCDLVGDAGSYVMYGSPNCAKGMPPQAGYVGHGSPAARFRNVEVRGA